MFIQQELRPLCWSYNLINDQRFPSILIGSAVSPYNVLVQYICIQKSIKKSLFTIIYTKWRTYIIYLAIMFCEHPVNILTLNTVISFGIRVSETLLIDLLMTTESSWESMYYKLFEYFSQRILYWSIELCTTYNSLIR